MVKMYSLYKLLEKSEEKYAVSLGTKAKHIFLISAITLKNMSKAQRFNFTYRAYGKRSR